MLAIAPRHASVIDLVADVLPPETLVSLSFTSAASTSNIKGQSMNGHVAKV